MAGFNIPVHTPDSWLSEAYCYAHLFDDTLDSGRSRKDSLFQAKTEFEGNPVLDSIRS